MREIEALAKAATTLMPTQAEPSPNGQHTPDAQDPNAEAAGPALPETQHPDASGTGVGVARLSSEPLSSSGDLHSLLGHYARLLWDIQKLRVMTRNRISAMERDGLSPEWMAMHNEVLDTLKAQERSVNRQLERLAKQHIMADWIDDCPGLGYGGFARIVGVTGSFLNFPNVAKVMKYMGLHVGNGRRPRRERGVAMVKTTEEAEGTAFSPQGQVVAHQIGEAIVKLGRGKYRIFYDKRKAEKMAAPRLGPSGCPMGHEHKKDGKVYPCISENGDGGEKSAHLHNHAMRVAVKELIKDMWVEWHRRANVAVKPSQSLPAVPAEAA